VLLLLKLLLLLLLLPRDGRRVGGVRGHGVQLRRGGCRRVGCGVGVRAGRVEQVRLVWLVRQLSVDRVRCYCVMVMLLVLLRWVE
jgi:hypothetical protein